MVRHPYRGHAAGGDLLLPADLADRDGAAPAQAQDTHSRDAVADCLSATTTLWLPVYAAGAAVLVGVGAVGR
ncbi:hypothetical protein AABB02_23750 [Streptomyces rimosus]|uniref:hypothetical protein n=1 Tax=Streptomyces rimosus TaxID=1927 RepID=UPI0031D94435